MRGTEYSDWLSNDVYAEYSIVEGMGGDDWITVVKPYPLTAPTVYASGGTGFDTLTVRGGFRAAADAYGYGGSGLSVHSSGLVYYTVHYNQMERLYLEGTTIGTGWFAGSHAIDIIAFNGTGGSGRILAGYGDDEVGLSGTFGVEVKVDGGHGKDRIDLSALAVHAAPVSAIGGEGDDVLIGSVNADILVGGHGADRLAGGDEAGILDIADYAQEGGPGSVAVNLAAAAETVNGVLLEAGTARDQFGFIDILGGIEGASGSDFDDGFVGGDGANLFSGWGGTDLLDGRGGDDVLAGGAGDDTLIGGEGIDTADFGTEPGEGDVLVNLRSGAVTSAAGLAVAGGTGRDRSGGTDTLSSIENVRTGAGHDSVWGNEAANVIETGLGNDFLAGGAGFDVLRGGLGDDVYEILQADHPFFQDHIFELAGEGTDEVRTDLALFSLVDLPQIEKLTALSDSAHDFRGNGADNLLTGAGGNDVLQLQDGGDDEAQGGAGQDGFFFGAALTAADKADGGAGRDYVTVQGDYALTLGAGLVNFELLTLLSGSDTRFGLSGMDRFTYNITTVDANATAAGGVVVVDAGQLLAGENFTFDSSAETDGSYRVWGGLGTDTLKGGLASDFYFFAAGRFGAGDTIDGGAGARNQLQLLGDYDIAFGAGQILNIHSIVFLSGRDIRENTDFDYRIAMHDQNLAKSALMTVDGAQLKATETLVFDGSAEVDGRFRIFGGQGRDTIAGSQGSDIIFGGGGGDRLAGGLGADAFSYRAAAESTGASFDTIEGFVFGTDTIDLPGAHDAYETRTGGSLSLASFDADLAAAMAGVLDANEAVLLTAGGGGLSGRLFLVVDQNGVAGYQSGADFVIELAATEVLKSLPDFIV